MECSTCHYNNPQDAFFCMKCGGKLQRECPTCGTKLPEDALFCVKCGKKLYLIDSPPGVKQAEVSFHQALDVMRRQQSISLELRAASSLYRLGQQQGKHNDSSKLLIEVYNRFTEGFDTPDLKEAKDLLQKIS